MDSRQDQLLETEDWRFHAVDKFGTGLAMIATEERLQTGSVVGFGVSSGPALFLSLAVNSYRKRISIDLPKLFVRHPPQGIYPDDHGPLFDYFEAAISEVIFSYSAIEAAMNELIPRDFTYRPPVRPGQSQKVLGKDEIERQMSLDDKMKYVLPRAIAKSSPAGGKLWPPYLELKSLRDRLMHMKSVDRKASGPEDKTVWGRLLRLASQNSPQIAANLIGHFYNQDRRWFAKFLKQ